MPARLLHALRLVAHLARRALSLEPIEHAPQHAGDRLRPVVSRVVGDALRQRVEARREREWSRAIERLLGGAEHGQDAAGALAGHVGAVVTGEEG